MSQSAEVQTVTIKEINESYHKTMDYVKIAKDSANSALLEATRCGVFLLGQKKECGHGAWLKWIEDNFDGSIQIAERWMKLGSNSSHVTNLIESGDHVSIRKALISITMIPDPQEIQSNMQTNSKKDGQEVVVTYIEKTQEFFDKLFEKQPLDDMDDNYRLKLAHQLKPLMELYYKLTGENPV